MASFVDVRMEANYNFVVTVSAFMLHLPVLWRILLRGKVKHFRKIVTSGLVVSKEARAIRSVLTSGVYSRQK